MDESYQICTRCVMDTTDPAITFDEAGVCNHCCEFDEVTSKGWFPNKEGAQRLKLIIEQIKTTGWRSYGRKHGESIFTKFFQNYYLPARFGYDKRRPHLSSLIVSGQMTKDDALIELERSLYDPDELETDINYFCKKLQISRAEFDELMTVPTHHYSEFPNQDRLFRGLKRMQRLYEKTFGKRVRVYS